MVGTGDAEFEGRRGKTADPADVTVALNRTTRRRIATHERILDAVRELVVEVGPSYTVAELADRADLGVGTIYNHFDDWRDDPLIEVSMRIIDEWRRFISGEIERQPSAADVVAAIVQQALAAEEHSWLHPRVADRLMQTQLWPDAAVLDLAIGLIDAGRADGSFAADIDAQLAAAALWGFARELGVLARSGRAIDSKEVLVVASRILRFNEVRIEPVEPIRPTES